MALAIRGAAFELRSAGSAGRCQPLNHEDTVSVFPELMASSQSRVPLVPPVGARAPWPRAVFGRLARVAPLGLSFELVMEAF